MYTQGGGNDFSIDHGWRQHLVTKQSTISYPQPCRLLATDLTPAPSLDFSRDPKFTPSSSSCQRRFRRRGLPRIRRVLWSSVRTGFETRVRQGPGQTISAGSWPMQNVYLTNVNIRPGESGSGSIDQVTFVNFRLPEFAGFAIPFLETRIAVQTMSVLRGSH